MFPFDDEEEPMRTMTVSRGSLTFFSQPRVERSLSEGVTVVPTRPLLWTGTTLELDSNTDSWTAPLTAAGSYPPRTLKSSFDDNSTTSVEPLTVLAVLRESNRARHSVGQPVSVH
jgi:hypothetical protein